MSQFLNRKLIGVDYLLAGAVATLVVVEALVIGGFWPAPAVLALGVWMATPGVVLVRTAVARSESSGILAWLVGPILGCGISVAGIFPWWAIGIQGWAALLLAPLATWGLVWLVARTGFPTLRVPAFTRRDVSVAAAVVLLVPLVTWAPYDHVRAPVEGGEAYRAYFTADFIWAMTVTGELAKGDVPPANPFLRDRPLNYYWFAHFLSGATYRNLADRTLTAEPVVLVNGLLFGVMFVLFAYALARTVGGSPGVSAVVVCCAFVANSYEGADMIRAALLDRIAWAEMLNTNVDAVTRWFYHGMAIDGLQRLLLYQPHHLTGYALALSALWLVALADDVTAVGVAFGAGSLLALALLFSTFGALIVSLAIGLLYLLRLLQQRALSSIWSCALLGGAPVVLGVIATSALGFTDNRYGFLLKVGLNPLATVDGPHVWLLSFGPLLIGALAACVSGRWVMNAGAGALTLILASLTFYFFTNVPDSGDVWVGWRAGHMLIVAFTILSGVWLTRLWQSSRHRLVVASAVALFVLPAVPTAAIDVYNAQDISNRTEGPGFPWTLVVTHAEREALEWVRWNTPPDAVVQIDPEARGAAHWSFIGAFAERRMVAGLPGSMTPLAPYRRAADDVQWGIFRTTQAEDCHAAARRLGIDYLFVGHPERRRYGPAIAAMRSDATLFPVVFENSSVTILQVMPTDVTSPERRAGTADYR